MAHVGRFYQLHFRRDLSIDTGNNNRGYAHAYDVGWSDITGIVGGPMTGDFVRCNAVAETSFNGAKWESAIFPAGGHLIRYTVETSLATGWPRNSARITVTDLTVGTLLAVNCVRVVGDDLGLIEGTEIETSPSHPPLLDTIGPNVLCQMFAVGWPP